MRIAALLLVAVVCACGDHVGQAASGRTAAANAATNAVRTPVPWTSAPPVSPMFVPPTVAPLPTGVPRCDPHALSLDPGHYQGVMGALAGVVYLENAGPRCLISGTFTLRFVDTRGVAVASARPGAADDQVSPGWALAGRAQIQWQGFSCDRDHPVDAIEIVYEGTTYRATERPFTGGHVCDSYPADLPQPPSPPAAVSVWPIRPEPTPQPPPTPPALLPAISAPARVRAGDTLNYVVTLTNTSAHSVTFDPCPWYLEWMLGRALPTDPPPADLPAFKAEHYVGTPKNAGQSKEAHALNCAGIGSLAPGESVPLAMQIRAPEDGEGEGTLRWEIAEPLARQATAHVTIDPR